MKKRAKKQRRVPTWGEAVMAPPPPPPPPPEPDWMQGLRALGACSGALIEFDKKSAVRALETAASRQLMWLVDALGLEPFMPRAPTPPHDRPYSLQLRSRGNSEHNLVNYYNLVVRPLLVQNAATIERHLNRLALCWKARDMLSKRCIDLSNMIASLERRLARARKRKP